MGTRNRFAISRPCCTTTAECPRCSADTDSVSVTLGGISSSTCDCSSLNATFVLARNSSDPCLWEYLGSFYCATYGTVGVSVLASVISGLGGRYYWSVTLQLTWSPFGLAEITWLWDSGAATAFDCTAEQTLSVNSYTSPTPTICTDWATMTCQVN
ncbi:MAG: hypothetical protein ACYC4U_11435 [Pirellulaceae bacterium]